MAVSFRVKALYEYSSPHDDDLNFPAGQIITVTEEEDDEWYSGEYTDDHGVKKEGIFPRNFVEKIEPTAPPRPSRSRPKKDPDAAQPEEVAAPAPPPPASAAEKPVSIDETEPEPYETEEHEHAGSRHPVPIVPVPVANKAVEPALSKSPSAVTSPPEVPKSAEKTAPKPKPGPPPVSEKPTANSFKDRIAAFNKPAAPPVAPFKPSGLGAGSGSGFVKKPFVAPPPSRNAYVPPPPREKPTANIYRREEDPEIKEREAETLDQAEKAGLVPTEQPQDGDDEDQPKPTSLKERIALLQKQQLEQAQRHAEAAAKKDKPKKPLKKKPETAIQGEEDTEAVEGPLSPSLERTVTAETEPRRSIDDAHTKALPPRRRASKGPAVDESHDGNEADMSGAGDTTEGQDDIAERDDSEEAPRHARRVPITSNTAAVEEQNNEEEQDEEEEEEEDVDPEVRRKEELRARMAKMSGGMGFHGMFGAPAPPAAKSPPKRKPSKSAEPSAIEEEAYESTSRVQAQAPPIPTPMAFPSLGNAPAPGRSHQEKGDDEEDYGDEPTPIPSRGAPPPLPTRARDYRDDADEEEDEATTPAPVAEVTSPRRDISGPPPIPGGRPIPPPVPTESRAPPPPPPAELKSATDGSESDDELSGGAKDKDLEQAGIQTQRSPPLPPQPASTLPLRSPPHSSRPDEFSPSSPPAENKRSSRPPPPIPGSAPALPPASGRPPPPPPPGDLSRQSTIDATVATPTRPPQAGEEEDEEVTEYEGDYDTDIGSSVPHKDALKAHARESSLEDNTIQSPARDAPPNIPPPIPSSAAPRAGPPPIPSQPPPESKRRSVDVPRAAPPPPPPAKEPFSPAGTDTDDYDPYNYSSPPLPLASSYSHKTPKIDEEQAYFPGPPAIIAASSPPERRPPPSAPPARPNNKQSLDLPRTSMSNRRSMDMHRPSVESDFIANDVDLALQSGWWKQASQVPPVFQGRKDIHFESEETTTTNQGAKTIITRDVFVLFQDYSQTVVTVRYDPYDPSDAELEQRHEPPPRALRQDQMEEFYERYGRQISEAATSKKDTVVGDGTPQALVMEMLRPLSGALLPVGTRSYGALVYANMGNASTQQQDVIRPGDIISFRNAKFQGKHGPMHAKYSAEVGKPDHVAVVAEWDGTKKKVRAWEQGRENKKVKMESYKLDDLRSGEVKIWRVVPRTWIGWNIQP
ncbi:assembly of actin patch protein [Conoideocrella luteorostrata]|uniref:Assembly of actin patch protein n=1 Tax=Conoideocrella luteorostrata TaxID=1105319 RepID=A0AAJ0D1J5_9HYPO|nr:assembly of actin patch protein [Conoideocrella luteorostrata]